MRVYKHLTHRGGYTLIEAITTIAILAILASLVALGVLQAQRYARDAVRKSDLAAVGVAFQARYDTDLCNNADDKDRFPGWKTFTPKPEWHPITDLRNYTDSCGSFSEFLATLPSDPRYPAQNSYRYDLSTKPVVGKSFRLAARLESSISAKEQNDICARSVVWVNSFGGQVYPGCSSVVTLPSTILLAAENTDIVDLCLPDSPCTTTGGNSNSAEGGASTTESGGADGSGGGSGSGSGSQVGDPIPVGVPVGSVLYNYFVGW